MSKTLKHMIERRDRFVKDHDNLNNLIVEQKQTLQIIQKSSDRSFFDKNIRLHVEQFRQKIEELQEQYKEALDLKLVFQLGGGNISEENKEEYEAINIDKNDFDFASYSLHLFSQFQHEIKALDLGMREYQQYLKLDQKSEEFQKRTQTLLKLLKEIDEFIKLSKKKLKGLNYELSRDLDNLISFCEDNVEHYSQIFNAIEESYDLVDKLLYFRFDKLKVMQKNLSTLGMRLDEIQYPFGIEKNKIFNKKILDILFVDLRESMKEMKKMKKQVKEMREDPNCQYFLSTRFRQSIKIIDLLCEMNENGDKLLYCIQFLNKTIEKEDEKNFRIFNESKKMKDKMLEIVAIVGKMRKDIEENQENGNDFTVISNKMRKAFIELKKLYADSNKMVSNLTEKSNDFKKIN